MDCSRGTCDGCGGVFGFDYDSAVVEAAESVGSIDLTLVRLVGTDGAVTVELDVTGGNATAVSDYGGTWPAQVRSIDALSISFTAFAFEGVCLPRPVVDTYHPALVFEVH